MDDSPACLRATDGRPAYRRLPGHALHRPHATAVFARLISKITCWDLPSVLPDIISADKVVGEPWTDTRNITQKSEMTRQQAIDQISRMVQHEAHGFQKRARERQSQVARDEQQEHELNNKPDNPRRRKVHVRWLGLALVLRVFQGD